MKTYIIKNAQVVNEGKIFQSDVLVSNGRIEKISPGISHPSAQVVDAGGNYLLPGVIDDQVHFREPGFTHKGDLYTEPKAAVAGGITSFMEMPNTQPQTLTQQLLEEKYALAQQKSIANFSFYMGASNSNTEELLKTDAQNVCGVKIFMGSSTGDMLVDDEKVLEKIFSTSPMLIACHCEDEKIIRANMEKFRKEYGEHVPMKFHPVIRSEEACYRSSSKAVELAKKHGARLHVLHISTARELELFDNSIPLTEKKITAEACIHHLWFDDTKYEELDTLIKWNPAIKTIMDKRELMNGVLDNRIDVIATDHAPHTLDEKHQLYFKAPSGGPLVQHALVAMLEFYHQGKITLEKIAEKMSHAVADCFRIRERGYIREGYWADLVLVDLKKSWKVKKWNILYKCAWSPFEEYVFKSSVTHTFVNGFLCYSKDGFDESQKGMRLTFDWPA